MENLRFRQIHLDFHTSEVLKNVGAKFDKKKFQEALIAGHVNSITLFSKCHHGYAFHPSKANEIHPGLDFDLLGAQLEACREIGVKAPVYISAGHDERSLNLHSEWLCVDKSGRALGGNDFLENIGYKLTCYNTEYMDVLVAQTEEVMQRYNPCGIFFDISAVRPCWCSKCRRDMIAKGLDPNNIDDVMAFAEEVYANYCKRLEEAIRKYNPDTTIFHNGGHIVRGRRDIANYDTHLELESLPTGGWGYDHFPMSASYAKTLGQQYLGMTGKFHGTWGEFGGFKHPNALRYETALSLAFGAKISIGDQLHPSGEVNMSTYKLIGKAYAEVEQKEPWCDNVESISDIAILSCEAFRSAGSRVDQPFGDIGANRIMLEGKYLYAIVDKQEDLSKYKLLILPDAVPVDSDLKAKLDAFIAKGGKILASGKSGLNPEQTEFALDLGVKYIGKNKYAPTYCEPSFETTNGITQYLMRESAYDIEVTDGEVIADMQNPYYNRGPLCFCSHQHFPNNTDDVMPGVVMTDNTAYIAWDIFSDYAKSGMLHQKEVVCHVVNTLLDSERTMLAALPDKAATTLMYQPAENRLVQHSVYAHTTVRGLNTEVIEDTVPLYDVKVAVKTAQKPARVYLAPQMQDIDFTYENGVVSYVVPKVDIHQMVVIDGTDVKKSCCCCGKCK